MQRNRSWWAAAVLGLALSVLSPNAALAEEEELIEYLYPRGPLVVFYNIGFGAPTGLFGLSVGYEFTPNWALETGFGFGFTGYQIPLMLRWYTPILEDFGPRNESLSAFSLALGPSVGLISKGLGLNVPHDEDRAVNESKLYAVGWLNFELAWETRGSWGGVFRAVIGGGPRILDNMSELCSKAVPERDGTIPMTSCDPPHFPSGPRIANSPAIFYLGVGFGWEFGR